MYVIYVKSQKKDSSSVGPLRGPDGQTYSSPGRKANILNDQFASVVTVEDEDDMPELEPALYEEPNCSAASRLTRRPAQMRSRPGF